MKTDSVIVEATKEQLNNIFHFNNEIGGYKFEDDKLPCKQQIILRRNKLIDFGITKPTIYKIESEKDFNLNDSDSIEKYNNEIKNILDKNNRIIIKADVAGAGKTTAASFGGSNVLYCTPFNMLCHILNMDEKEAITVCKLLKLRVNGDDETKKRTRYDTTDYDTIIFDEVLMHPPEVLSRIYKFMVKNPEKKIIPTGDTDQLPCISFNINNVKDQKQQS